ncbi:ATP-binding cassette domain-containing protein (plasmid) [Rhodococcus sp. USK10]|uniref:ABC transporter ATP-binding protein n=1 Tax=Rhodococcus sp. USK10 TaxID=2789739 RepID=UPI001C5DA570|nr:ATP-binding cassette domain-containing protein [Rhodococcus sp. USK10]QYB00292.1 ATP-binding cassette domain-containing protein [Rhodococcus sp. USK10]
MTAELETDHPAAAIAEAVALKGVSVAYGAATVLSEIDLVVPKSQFLAVLGANGAGKTTLLSVLAGLVRPSAGAVRLGGEAAPREAHRRYRRGLAFIGDDRQIFPKLTVEQSMRLVDCREEPRELFPELELLWQRRVGLLSGGEQQMVALARALAAHTSIVVVDELSQGLAPIIRDRLLGQLRTAASGGTTVIVVEQAVDAVLTVADEGVVLRQGRIIDHRPAADLLNDRDRVVASFLE